MQNSVNSVTPPLDARCALLLLLLANIIAFTQELLWIELGFLAVLCLLMILCDCGKQALKWTLVFLILAVIQYVLFPIVMKSIATAFTIIVVYARKMLPCLMVGTIIVKKIPMQYLILALRKAHFPQSAVIPLSVTVRYIPSIREEYRHIRNAIKLRNIRGFKKIECIVVPLMMSAINTSDELSAAAVTRGIENLCRKTSAVNMSFYFLDYIFLVVVLCFTVLSVLSKGGAL